MQRGVHFAAMDGPGQGKSNMRKIRVTDTNYEEAGKAVIDHLVEHPAIDADRIAVMGRSMGSFWAPRIAAHDPRAATSANFAPKVFIFNQASPRFKQVFMYMAGMTDDEEAFDEMAERMVLTGGYAGRIRCPTLLVTGEFDPLSPVEYAKAVYDAGWSERALFDAIQVAALFHYMNRIIEGTGVAFDFSAIANDEDELELRRRRSYTDFGKSIGIE